MKINTYSSVTVTDIVDNGVASTDVMYYLSTSNTECVGGSWVTDPPAWENGKYIWQKTVTTYTGTKEPTETSPVCITGGRGEDGIGIKSIISYYLTSDQSTGITIDTSGWDTEVVNMSEEKPYLWKYEIYIRTDDSQIVGVPCVVGTMGATGADGNPGKAIIEVRNYYLISSSDSGITEAGHSWSSSPLVTDVTNKYLWTYEEFVYDDGTSYNTAPHVIGVHGESGPKGDKGDPGQEGTGIESYREEYYLSDSKTTQIGGEWTTEPPKWSVGKYIWTRTKITYKNPTSIFYTSPVCDSSWDMVNSIEIGGKNLLRNTSSIIAYDYKVCNWTLDSLDVVITSDIDEATDSLHIITNGEGSEHNGLGSVISGIQFKHGETYTFSCAIRGTYDLSKTFGGQLYYCNTNGEYVYDVNSKTTWVDDGDGINDGISPTDFQRRYFTFVVPYDYDEASNYLVINIFCNIMDIYVRNFQLERGNKATDWRMADEDMESMIESAVSTISGVTSKVDQVTQSITNRVWVTDINEYINNYDQSTVQVISQKQNQYQQTIDALNINISDIQTSLTTKADGSTVTSLESKLNNAINDVNGFKQTVSETYATQNDLNNVKTNYTQKTEFQQLSNKFSWLVSSNSSSTSLTLTDSMIDAMTKQFVVKSPDGKRVVIENGIVKTDFLQSHNYVAGTGTPKYSSSGTFFNMADGAMYSKNFVIDSNGNAYLKGTIYATAGKIGDCIIANGKLTIPAANITGKLEADHIIVGSSSLDDELQDLINGKYAQFDGEGSTLGYCHLAQIKITSAYTNDAIVIGINQRGNGYSQCCITFSNVNGTDPALSKFLQIGTAEWRIAKASAGLWNLYVKKYEAHDSITVTEYQNVRAGKTLTWICENSEVPAGATYATKCASFVEIDSTAGGTAGSGALITSGAANSINNKADAAQSAANSAQSTANSAQSTANSAQSTANSANQTAQNAQNTANSVKDVADDAKEIASAAQEDLELYKNTALQRFEANEQTIQMVQNTVGGFQTSIDAANDLAQAAQDVAEITNGKLTPLLNWCKEDGGKTYIDGGWIISNSIAANSIKAGSITATQIKSGEIISEVLKAGTIVGTHGQINLQEGTFAYWNDNKTSGIGWGANGQLQLIGSGTFSGTVTCSYLTAIQSGRIANWYFNSQCIYNSYNRNNNYNPNGSHNYDGAWGGAGIYFGERGLSIGSPTTSSEFRVTEDGDFTGTYATITGVLDTQVVQSVNGYKVGMKFATEQDSTTYSGFHVISYQSQNKRILIGRLSDRNSSPVTNRGYFAFGDDTYIRVNGSFAGTVYFDDNINVGNKVTANMISASDVSSTNTLAAGGNIFTNGTLFLQIGANVPVISNGKTLLRDSTSGMSGRVGVQSSSSKRYKNYINSVANDDAMNLLNLDVVTFKYKDGYLASGDEWENKIIPGFFAEDVEKINPILCTYDDDIVEDWNYRTMIPYMLKIDQVQQDNIKQLKQENDSLKQRLSKIESLLAKLNITEEI